MTEYEFKMPRMGESITDAAIITWFKNKGDTIEIDEPLLEVATDKVDSEVVSTVSGVIHKLLFKPNEIIKIGQVIAIIRTDAGARSSRGKILKRQNIIWREEAGC